MNPIHAASWIWCNDTPTEFNQYGLFRRRLELPAAPGMVRVHACADMRYWLYVNGVRVGFGPGRYNDRFPQYDTHDVTRHVRPGRNVVALKVHSIGPEPAITSFISVRAGLIAADRQLTQLISQVGAQCLPLSDGGVQQAAERDQCDAVINDALGGCCHRRGQSYPAVARRTGR